MLIFGQVILKKRELMSCFVVWKNQLTSDDVGTIKRHNGTVGPSHQKKFLKSDYLEMFCHKAQIFGFSTFEKDWQGLGQNGPYWPIGSFSLPIFWCGGHKNRFRGGRDMAKMKIVFFCRKNFCDKKKNNRDKKKKTTLVFGGFWPPKASHLSKTTFYRF